MMRRAVFLIMAALVVAGCGDDEADPTAPTREATSAPDTGPAAARGIEQYLRRMRVLTDDVEELRREFTEATEGLSQQPDETWIAAGMALAELAPRIADAGEQLAALEPPPALREAHAAREESLRLASDQLEEGAAALRSGNVDALLAFATQVARPRLVEIQELRSRWRREVTRAANEADIDVPAWVGEIGTTR